MHRCEGVEGMTDILNYAPPLSRRSAADIAPRRRPMVTINLTGNVERDGPISSAIVRDRLSVVESPDAHLCLHVNSSGGDTVEAFKIYDTLRACPLRMTAVAGAEVASAALIIFLAAEHRVAAPDTRFLIHMSHRSGEGLGQCNARDLHRAADNLSAIDSRILDLIAMRTSFDRSFFQHVMQDEDYTPAALALETGIVHEVDGAGPHCDPSWPDQATAFVAAGGLLPRRALTANYFAACRSAPARKNARERDLEHFRGDNG
jgi:ATP-dependent Clp protease protease subunit